MARACTIFRRYTCVYSLKVTASGFEASEKTGIVMNVAATVREDVKLAVGAGSTTVTVQAMPSTWRRT